MAGLPVVRTGNVALDRFLEAVREYIETSKGGGNPQSKDRVLRVSDLPAVIQLATASIESAPMRQFSASEIERLASDIGNTRVFRSLTSAGSALDGVVDGYPREVLADIRSTGLSGASNVTSEAIVSTTDTQSLAAQLTTVTARLDDFDGTATIEEAYLALADKTTGLEAQYTMKVTAGGAVAGFGLAATSPVGGTPSSAFLVAADKFAIVSPSYAGGLTNTPNFANVPFGVDASGVYINGAVRINAGGTAIEDISAGAQGQFTSIVFIRSASAPTLPTGGTYLSPLPTSSPTWSDAIPAGTDPVYMATRIFTSDGAAPQQLEWSTPRLATSIGQGTKVQFSIDGLTGWHDTPSAGDEYMRTGTSTDGGATWSYAGSVKIKGEQGPQGIQGLQGNQGLQGLPGENGQTLYTWVAYADNATGTVGFTTGSNTGQTYIGIANNKTTATEGTNPADYTWSLIKGEQGIPGTPGTNGQTTYTWFAYANDAAGSTGFTTGAWTNQTYIGIATNKLTATESTNPADYSWSLIKGEQGQQGIKGDPGDPGTPGVRGPARTVRTIAGSAWSDTEANAAITALGFASNVVRDEVTLRNSDTAPTFLETKYWSGSAWTPIGVSINGNLLVSGSITSDKIGTNLLTAVNIETSGSVNGNGQAIFSGNNASGIPVYIRGGLLYINPSIYARAFDAATGNVRSGLFGYSSSTDAAWDVGVVGYAPNTSRGMGMAGVGANVGGYFAGSNNAAVALWASANATTSTALRVDGMINWGGRNYPQPDGSPTKYLSADGSWSTPSASGGVTSFNSRTGAVSLTSADITNAQAFTPVQQGGGTGQGTNKLYMGWDGANLRLQVDTTNFGSSWPISISGNANYATSAGSATSATSATSAASATNSSQLGGYGPALYLRRNTFQVGAPSGTAYTIYAEVDGIIVRIPAFYP